MSKIYFAKVNELNNVVFSVRKKKKWDATRMVKKLVQKEGLAWGKLCGNGCEEMDLARHRSTSEDAGGQGQ